MNSSISLTIPDKHITNRKYRVWTFSILIMVLTSCQTNLETAKADATSNVNNASFGVLVMAHGGTAEWNASVVESVAPLQSRFPVEIAFGMADASSIQAGIARLESRGVDQIGVVRLFISGESWFERTSQILGLTPGAPLKPATHSDDIHTAHGAGAASHIPMAFWQVETSAKLAMSIEGLSEAKEMDSVLLSRMSSLSSSPASEVVVVLAHGPGDDGENQRWINQIEQRLTQTQQSLAFDEIRVFTLREDWQDKRVEAEHQIRAYVSAASETGKTVIVVPYRVQGFGPYRDVLAGLNYRADGLGLVPHDNVSLWIENQAQQLQRELARMQAKSNRQYQLAHNALE
ncbi:MAG: sirohydrochlorin cobaltochelatase [Pseudohongiellaceae bacterium]|jgi:sirohydrochlorin cobaltochelatase